MRQVSKNPLICMSVAAAIFMLLSSVQLIRYSPYAVSREDDLTQVASTEQTDLSTTQERTNIFFLKTHKCASSTLQNILMRYGLDRGLAFVLPNTGNYVGHPEPFNPKLIFENVVTESGKYNIFTHHSRYNKTGVKEVMYDNAVFVTIVRHPAYVYESLFSYYGLGMMFNITFEELLKSEESVKKVNKRFFKRIGFNQMSFDLGFEERDFNDSEKILKFIEQIDEDFHLVMISEWMEVSLVLLADVMNWPLENVVSLKLNSRPDDLIYKMSFIEKNKILQLNNVDQYLYNYFFKKFIVKIKDYGVEKMKRDVQRLLHLNSKLQFRCVKGTNTKGFAHTQSYELKDENDRLCSYAAMNELKFSEELRRIQQYRTDVLNRLNALFVFS